MKLNLSIGALTLACTVLANCIVPVGHAYHFTTKEGEGSELSSAENTPQLASPSVDEVLVEIEREISLARADNKTLPVELADLLVKKVDTLRKMSRHLDGMQALELLREFAREHQLTFYLAKADYLEGMLFKERGEYQRAIPKFEAAEAVFAKLNEYKHQVRAMRRAAFSLRSNGDLEQAIAYAEKALEIAKRHQLNNEIARALGTLADIYSNIGLYQEALDYDLEQFKYQPIESASLEGRSNSFYALAERYMRLEDYVSAKEYFHKALVIDRKLNVPVYIGHSLVKLSQVYRRAQEYDAAMAFAQEAQVVFGSANIARHVAWAKSNVGNIYLDQKRFAEAIHHLADAEATLTLLDEKSLLNKIKVSLAKAHIGLGDNDTAEDYLMSVLAFAKSSNSYNLLVDTLEGLVKLMKDKADYQRAFEFQLTLSDEKVKKNAQIYSFRTAKQKHSLETIGKDAEIKILEAEKLHSELKLKEEKIRKRSAVTAVVLLSVLLLIVLYVLYSRRKLANMRQAMLAESIERRNQLFADVSHELRTPLSVLKLQLQALEYGLITDKETTFSKLHEKIAEIDVLIDDIYQIACLEAQILKLSIGQISLLNWLTQVASDYSGLASEKQLRFQQSINIATNATLMADSIRLKQAVMNVIRNSVKHTDAPGEAQFKAFVDNERLIVVIEDSAPGVDKRDLPKIFQRLYRADGTRGRDLGGSGLGLTIAKSIVELHGGKIRADASELGGLKVYISLPLLREKNENTDSEN